LILIFLGYPRISKAGGAEREAIEDVLSVMRVPKVKRTSAQKLSPSPSVGSIGSNQSSGFLPLCDGSVGEAPGGTSSSACMEVDQLESNLAAIQGLVQTRW